MSDLQDRLFSIRAAADRAIAAAHDHGDLMAELLIRNQMEMLEMIAALQGELAELRREMEKG